MLSRIPRESVVRIAGQLRDVLREGQATGQLPPCQLVVVGGYRRGKEVSGDVDVLISPPEQEDIRSILSTTMDRLTSLGRIVDVLSYGDGQTRRHSARLLKDPAAVDRLDKCLCIYREAAGVPLRRVDLIVAPRSQFPFALLGWSGSRQFERSIRLFARRERGMHLASHALLDAHGTCIKAETEEDVFRALGLEYIPPEYRNC